jgi:hypothetical protein
MPFNRTRRRILIATLVVVGIVVALWQFATRVDRRFVGTWQIGESSDFATLKANGEVDAVFAGPTGHRVMMGTRRIRWWVSNGEFHELQSDGSDLEYFRDVGLQLIGLRDAVKPAGIHWSREVVEVTDSMIRFRDGSGELVLMRVSR